VGKSLRVMGKSAAPPVRHLKPSDVLSGMVPGDDPSWAQTFAYIEQEHVHTDPKYWGSFLDHVQQHGVQTPIVVLRDQGKRKVISGHHRVWAAVKRKLPTVPIIETSNRAQRAGLGARRPGAWGAGAVRLVRDGLVATETIA
jgi:hypothetical protein